MTVHVVGVRPVKPPAIMSPVQFEAFCSCGWTSVVCKATGGARKTINEARDDARRLGVRHYRESSAR